MRTKKRKPLCAIISDPHLRDSQPPCRSDLFMNIQFGKLDFIRKICRNLNAPVEIPLLISGDVFHHWKPSPFLLSRAIELLPENVWAIAGQHDLPFHNLQQFHESGLNTLVQAKKIQGGGTPFYITEEENFVLAGFHYGAHNNAKHVKNMWDKPLIGLFHFLTYLGKNPWPGFKGPDAEEVLDSLPQFDLIIVGDNHEWFSLTKHDRTILSPGALSRQNLGEIKHLPHIWTWDGKRVDQIPIPISPEEECFYQERIDRNKGDAGLLAYAEHVRKTKPMRSLSFADNLEVIMNKHEVEPRTRHLIAASMEG